MLLSIVIFSFGTVISFIVLLGAMNARDIKRRQADFTSVQQAIRETPVTDASNAQQPQPDTSPAWANRSA